MDFPPGEKAIGSKWEYKIKYKANGDIYGYKARFISRVLLSKKILIIMRLFHHWLK